MGYDARLTSNPTSLELSPRCPFRPPWWRWARAGDVHCGTWDDQWVGRARRFRQYPGRSTRAASDRVLHEASAICSRKPRQRWEIESRILAGQSDETITSRTGVTSAVVEAYEALFFSVRGRLTHPDWIATVVINPRDLDPLEVLWKRFAYSGGPFVLEAILEHHDAEQAGRDGAARSTLGRLIHLAGLVDAIDVSDITAGKLMELDAMARDIQSREVAEAVGPIVAPAIEDVIRAAYRPSDDAGSRPGGELAEADLRDGPETTGSSPVIAPPWPYRATG